MSFIRWTGANFTDQNKVLDPGSNHICSPCVWAHAWNPPPGAPPAESGKKGANLRMYSHLWHDGEYRSANKADKRAVAEWLRNPKSGTWFACIADSGQKHLLPYTPLNPARSRRCVIRFEEQTVSIGDWAMLDQAVELLTDGVSKGELATGIYGPRAWIRSAAAIRLFESRWQRDRGGAWFTLVLWLAQRNEEEYSRRADGRKQARTAEAAHRKRAASSKKRIPERGSEPAEALGPDSGQATHGGPDQRRCARMDHRPESVTRTERPEQGSLFGD